MNVNGVSYLESSTARVGIDFRGSIVSIYDRRTSTEFIRGETTPSLLRLILPLPDWQGHYLELREVKLSCEPAEQGGTVDLSADALTSSAGVFNLRVTSQVELQGSTLRFRLACFNGTDRVLTEVQFPRIGGLTSLTDDPSDTTLLVPGFFQGAMIPDVVGALRPVNAWLTSAPGDGRRVWMYPRTLQWTDLFSRDLGLYFALEDPELRAKALLLELTDTASFTVAWVHYPHAQSDTSFSTDTPRTVLHQGDWHAGADLYRTWSADRFPPKRVSPKLREQLGWHFAFLKHGDGRVIRRYDELPAFHAGARAAGFSILQIFGFHSHGMDRGYPDYEPDDALGGAVALKRALDQVRQDGGRVALYQAGSAANLFCGKHSEDVQSWAVRTGRGELVRGDWTWSIHDTNHWIREEPFLLMCYGTGWKDHLVSVARRYVERYGAGAVHFDHIGDFGFAPCYAEPHAHDSPERAAAAVSDLLASVAAEIHRADPDAALFCEGMSEVSVPFVDIHWGQNSLSRHPEVFRYLYPDALFTTTVQENQYAEAAKAVVAGLLVDLVIELGCGSIASYPDFADHLRRLAEFKLRHKRFLVYGGFADERGLAVPDGLFAKAYVTATQAAVAAVSSSENVLRLGIDWDALGVRSASRIERHTSSGGVTVLAADDDDSYEVGPSELVLFAAESEHHSEGEDFTPS